MQRVGAETPKVNQKGGQREKNQELAGRRAQRLDPSARGFLSHPITLFLSNAGGREDTRGGGEGMVVVTVHVH